MGILACMGLCLVCFGCESAGGISPFAKVDTIGGVIRVENPDSGVWAPGEAWVAEELWRVGGLDAPEHDQFTNAWQVLSFAPDGRLFAADFSSARVRIYSATGEFLKVFGRMGDGPEDLSAPFGLGWGPRGNLWVGEGFTGQYTIFTPEGEFVGTGMRPLNRILRRATRLEFDSLGHVYEYNAPDRRQGVLQIAPDEDEILAAWTVVVPPEPPTGRTVFFGTDPDNPLRRFSSTLMRYSHTDWRRDGSVVVHIAGTSTIVELDRRGDTVRVIDADHRQRALTAAEQEVVDAVEAEYDLNPGDVAVPTYVGLWWREDGHILAQVAGELSEATSDFDVFDPVGRFLGTVRFPFAQARIGDLAFRGERFAGVATGDLDVPYVVAGQLRRPTDF